MLRMLVLLVLLAPTVAAQVPADAAPQAVEPPAWKSAMAGATSAVSTGVSAAGDAAASVGSGIASGASAIANGIQSAAAAIGSAVAAAGAALWTGLTWAVAGIGSLVASLANLLASGARSGAGFVRAHPKESAIVAGSAAGATGLAWLVKRFWIGAFVPLYSRLAPGEMLDNAARSRVYEHVRANPGAHPSGIAQALDLGWGTVIYHLARLEQSQLVTAKSANHRKCYFAAGGALGAQEKAAVAAMSTDKAKLIVGVVREAPGITQKALAERVGMSQALASWHVKRLIAQGVLQVIRNGRSNELTVAGHVPMMTAPAPVAALAACIKL